MAERGILFSAPMVRALLAGTKTQTRPAAKLTHAGHVKEPRGHRRWHPGDPDAVAACPYGKPGDRLWVRETHCAFDAGRVHYRADHAHNPAGDKAHGIKWTPAIHMPRWASRITLEITGVRVERLQEISEADAIAEGVPNQTRLTGHDKESGCQWGPAEPVAEYCQLWESINGPGSWAANPWVWVLEFKRVPA